MKMSVTRLLPWGIHNQPGSQGHGRESRLSLRRTCCQTLVDKFDPIIVA